VKLRIKNSPTKPEPVFTLLLEGGDDGAQLLIEDEAGNRAGLIQINVEGGLLDIQKSLHYGNFKGFPIRHITFFPNSQCQKSSASVIYDREVR